LTKDDFVLVVIFRALPYLFSLVMALMIKKYDIKRFKKLPTSIVVIICIISCLLLLICVLSVFLIENTMNSEILFTIIYSFLLVVLILAYYTSYKIINDRHRLIEKEVEASMSNAERESIKVYEQNREEISIIRS
jgi:amino acid permease